jgi:hypothetical protein
MTVIAGLPSLDVYTLSETWALGEALHALWARDRRQPGPAAVALAG